MSESGGAGRREVAYRLFAAEYDDATFEYSEEDEERAPNYVVTPTGARANRLFVVGVLTEVERVSDDVLRGRIVDPTGAFVVYAGQYQPDPKTFLERAEPPAFVSVTGKARTFTPDGSDRVLTSVRPESINEVDAETRDRWVVGTAAHTVERVAAFAEALERPERGDELRDAFLADGVDEGLAEGIALAIDHYGTTEAYLTAVRELAIQAAAVVAGERDEVESLDVAPDEGGPAEADLSTAESGGLATSSGGATAEPDTGAAGELGESGTSPAANEPASEATSTEGDVGADATGADPTATAETDTETTTDTETAEPAESGADAEAIGDADEGATDSDRGEIDGDAADADEQPAAASTDDLYELDEEERERVTEEYGTEFTTGSEVDEPGEAEIETPQPTEESEPDGEAEAERDDTAGAGESDVDADETTEESPGGPDEDAADPAEDDVAEEADDEPPEDVDLETAVVDAMADLDDGDGAERDEVVAAVVDEYGADPGAVEDAIQDALMSGLCYEPGEDRLKAI